jgi:hypothetical protein
VTPPLAGELKEGENETYREVDVKISRTLQGRLLYHVPGMTLNYPSYT